VAERTKRGFFGEPLHGSFEHREHRGMGIRINLAGNFFAVGGEPMLA
jgi:hypothetical protein